MRVPEFGGEEDVGTGYAGGEDAGADFCFVVVGGCGVDVAVAVAEGDLDGVGDLVRGG